MERLSDRAIEIINELHTERLDYNSEYLPLIDAAQKLNDIETVMGDYDLDRLRELAQVDREGRCVVLPVKPGETVRFIGNPSAKPEVVDAISVYADGRITYNFHTTGMMTRYVDEWSEDDAYKYCSVNGTMKEGENDG